MILYSRFKCEHLGAKQHRCFLILTLLYFYISFCIDKRILTVLASLFVVALASSGDTPEDPVFYCLNGLSGEIRSCYVSD